MENKGKTVVVYYINIGNMEEKDVESYINKIKENISIKSAVPNVVEIFFPSRQKEGIETFYIV